MGCLPQTSALRAHGSMWKRTWKECKSQREWMTPTNLSFKYNKTGAHMKSQRLQQHTQGLYRCKLYGVPVLRQGSSHGLPFLTKTLFPIDICLQKKNKLSSKQSHWIYQPYLRLWPMPSNRWQKQNELNGILVDVLFHIPLFGYFSSCQYFACILCFPILCFYGGGGGVFVVPVSSAFLLFCSHLFIPVCLLQKEGKEAWLCGKDLGESRRGKTDQNIL